QHNVRLDPSAVAWPAQLSSQMALYRRYSRKPNLSTSHSILLGQTLGFPGFFGLCHAKHECFLGKSFPISTRSAPLFLRPRFHDALTKTPYFLARCPSHKPGQICSQDVPRGLITCLFATQQPRLAPRNSSVTGRLSDSANRFAGPTAIRNS